MNDVDCPYCGCGQEINHDDGYGYDEDEKYEQECSCCGKNFVFMTSFMVLHDVCKADCLNGLDHKYKATSTYPRRYSKMRCEDCGDERKPTAEEMKKILEE